MGLITAQDEDFRVVVVTRDELIALQHDAERHRWGTRWSSERAVLREVGPSPLYLCPLLREHRDGELRSYRCLVLHSLPGLDGAALVTLDVAPDRWREMPALALDGATRAAFSRLFAVLRSSSALRPKG